MTLTRERLKELGFVQVSPGVWKKPGKTCGIVAAVADPVRPVEADRSKPATARALDDRIAKHKGLPRGLAVRVVLVARRKRLLDPDAVAFAFKPGTDLVCASLGIDDADPCVEFEWRQVKTNFREGVMVHIELVETN